MNLPIYYQMENVITASGSPNILHCKNTTLVNIFKRYLYQSAVSTLKINIPDTWNRDYFLYTLFSMGYIAVVNTNKFGVICQFCGLYGQDIYYAPTHVTISNPLLSGILTPRIHVQCEVLKLTPDYCGIDDLVTYYANKLALCAENVDMNLINSKLAYLFIAGNKSASGTFKTLFDDIASGKPAVVVDKTLVNEDGTLGIELFNQHLKETYIASDVLEDMRKIRADFNTVIGIPNANTDKKERLISDEVNANNTETQSRLDLWVESLNECAEKANKMFGLSLHFDSKYKVNDEMKEGDSIVKPKSND